MPGIVFDTSVIIAYRSPELPKNALMSAVVIQELAAGAADKSILQFWATARRLHEKAGTLLVPTGEDWWEAGRVLYALLHGLKSKSGGLTPRLPFDEKQRIIRDVLIARTVKQAGALLVTENVKDFARIRKFCRVRFVGGREYFS
jgi:predicted nucleic acid-binding protein